MPRLQPVDPDAVGGKAKDLLDAVKAKLGAQPNILKTMAQSPAVLQSYLSFSGALGEGLLDGKLREQVALAVGQANDCHYCLAAHTMLGGMAGVSKEEALASRRAESSDAKTDAALKFVKKLVEQRGNVTDDDVESVRSAGFGDGEIAELVATVALNIFTNYFNHVAQTEVDFPHAPALT